MKLRRRNPEHMTPMRQAVNAIGMGVGIAGVGAVVGDFYRRPSISLGGLVLGIGVTAIHFPWPRIGGST